MKFSHLASFMVLWPAHMHNIHISLLEWLNMEGSETQSDPMAGCWDDPAKQRYNRAGKSQSFYYITENKERPFLLTESTCWSLILMAEDSVLCWTDSLKDAGMILDQIVYATSGRISVCFCSLSSLICLTREAFINISWRQIWGLMPSIFSESYMQHNMRASTNTHTHTHWLFCIEPQLHVRYVITTSQQYLICAIIHKRQKNTLGHFVQFKFG